MRIVRKRQIIITALLLIGGAVFFSFYKDIDPTQATYVPKCFVNTIFGVRCPGCGTQRALHAILNGDITTAIAFNPLIVLSVPYVILLIYMEWLGGQRRFPKLHSYVCGQYGLLVLLTVLVIYTLMRNLFGF